MVFIRDISGLLGPVKSGRVKPVGLATRKQSGPSFCACVYLDKRNLIEKMLTVTVAERARIPVWKIFCGQWCVSWWRASVLLHR